MQANLIGAALDQADRRCLRVDLLGARPFIGGGFGAIPTYSSVS
jgi:hypothetical protein